MALFVCLCTIDADRLDLFGRLRGDHYAFLVAERHRIRFGGPARGTEGGRPETMIIVVEADDRGDAEAWIAREPYNANGGFSHVAVRFWTQVIPEPEAGALELTLAGERAKAGER